MTIAARFAHRPSVVVATIRRIARSLFIGLLVACALPSAAHAFSIRTDDLAPSPASAAAAISELDFALEPERSIFAVHGSPRESVWDAIYSVRHDVASDPIGGTTFDFRGAPAADETFVDNPEPNVGLLSGLGLLGLAARRYRRRNDSPDAVDRSDGDGARRVGRVTG